MLIEKNIIMLLVGLGMIMIENIKYFNICCSINLLRSLVSYKFVIISYIYFSNVVLVFI